MDFYELLLAEKLNGGGGGGGGGGGWQRPSGFPDLESLDISDEEAIYMTYKTNTPNSVASFTLNTASTWYVDIGTIENGSYVVKSTDTLAKNDVYMKDLTGYTEDYIVLRARGTISGNSIYGWFREYNDNGRKLASIAQYLVEVYARLPNVTTFHSVFRVLSYIRSIKIIDAKADNVSLERVAGECSSLERFYIDGITEASLYYAFNLCKSLKYLYLNGLTAKDLKNAFDSCCLYDHDLNTLKIGTNSVSNMFQNSKIDELDWSVQERSQTSLENAFKGSTLKKIDLSKFTLTGTLKDAFNGTLIESIPPAHYGAITNWAGTFYGTKLYGDIDATFTGIQVVNVTFAYCPDITSIILPNTVTQISANAFQHTDSLTEIHMKNTTPPTLDNSNAFTNSTNSNLKIYVPYSEDHSVLSSYQTATNWSSIASKIVEEAQ